MRRHEACSIAALLATASAVAALPGEAQAAERVVMPYECRMLSDRMSVRPGSERSYEIIGRRDEQAFTACDASGDRCTTMMVQKFMIDCDGHRVPWMRVADAVPAPQGSRTWVERGRLVISRPVESVPGDATACAEEPGGRRSRNRECLPWKPRPAMMRLTLPEGFAPLSLAHARLDVAAGAAGSAATPPRSIDDLIAATSAEEQRARAAPTPDPRHGSTSGTNPPGAAVVPGPATSAAGGVVAEAKSAAATAPKAQHPANDKMIVLEARDLSEASESAEPGTAQPAMRWLWLGALAGLGGIAVLLRAVPPVRRERTMIRARYKSLYKLSRLREAGARGVANLKQLMPDRASAPAPISAQADGDIALANAAWAAAALLEQIERLVAGLERGTAFRAVLEEELAAIQQGLMATRAGVLGGESSELAAAEFRSHVRELERVKRIAESAAASIAPTRDAFAVPSSKSEAFALLGVNPDVSEQALKRLVDALRLTWHPDHARSEIDRQEREARMKQINVAWELISERRRAA